MKTIAIDKLGKEVSTIGLGCGDLSEKGKQEGYRIVEAAFEGGINYFDVAPSYGDGENEEIVAEVLEGVEQSVVSTKVLYRGYDNAKKEITKSLERLGYIDILFLHSVDTKKALDVTLSRNGAIKAAEKFKSQGDVGLVGISNHHDSSVLKSSLSQYSFNSAMFPVSVFSSQVMDFDKVLTEYSTELVTIGILVYGGKDYAEDLDQQKRKDLLRYSIHSEASSILVSAKTAKQLQENLNLYKQGQAEGGLSKEELEELQDYSSTLLQQKTPWWLDQSVGVRKI